MKIFIHFIGGLNRKKPEEVKRREKRKGKENQCKNIRYFSAF